MFPYISALLSSFQVGKPSNLKLVLYDNNTSLLIPSHISWLFLLFR